MSITYEHIMELNYDIEISPIEWAKISNTLHQENIHLVKSSYQDTVEPKNYGYQDTTKRSVTYVIELNGQHTFESDYSHLTNQIIDAINAKSDIKAKLVTKVDEQTKSEWVSPAGKCVVLNFKGRKGYDGYYATTTLYDSGVRLYVTLSNVNNNTIVLKFRKGWEVETIKSKKEIDAAMVEFPLPDMGYVQGAVEDAITKEKFHTSSGEITELIDPEVECYFRAITDAKSECTPDIIQRTRDAKLALRDRIVTTELGEDE